MEKNETTAKGGFLAAISIAALFFSSYVGPGFAAGTQTVSYFLTKGSMGVIFAPALVGVLTFFWCYLTFEFNRIYKPKDYREQSDMIYKNPVARHALGIFKDVFAIIQVLLVVSGMISGAATILAKVTRDRLMKVIGKCISFSYMYSDATAAATVQIDMSNV